MSVYISMPITIDKVNIGGQCGAITSYLKDIACIFKGLIVLHN